ncbi:MAG: MFS transporter [Lentisphaerae bacterium]|nr:MFS transporter [Lentisphaerota bacterium]
MWKNNLAMVGLSQFLSMLGFAFAMPFAPYYIQELGITDQSELKKWVAVFTAATPLTLAIFAPIWGAIGDRYGRRLMLLRANLAGMIVVALMGVVPNVQMLVGLRLLQGALTGTMAAAQIFVSVHSSQRRSGQALGMLSAAVYSGSMIGAFIGGIFAEWLGYRLAFIASSAFLALASLLVLLGTREQFVPPVGELVEPSLEERVKLVWTKMGPALPILTVVGIIGFVLQFDFAWLPLLVQDIHGSLKGAAFLTGLLSAITGIAGFIAGPVIGRLADMVAPPRIAKISALMGGVMLILIAFAQNFGLLLGARFGAAFCAAGLDPVFQIWLAKTTPAASRGMIFGWATTARALGWMSAPLVSGTIAWMFGLRAVFFSASAIFFLLIPVITLIVGRLRQTKE